MKRLAETFGLLPASLAGAALAGALFSTSPAMAASPNCATSNLPSPAAGQIFTADRSAEKSRALLGGSSRLAQLRSEQASAAIAAPAPVAPFPAGTMASIPAGDCNNAILPQAIRPSLTPGQIPAPRTDRPDVFGSVALAVSRTPFDARWRRASTAGLGEGAWSQAIRSVQGQSRITQLQTINKWVNARISYVDDIRQHGVADYWSTASETLANGRGDCEDYAIVKHSLLRRMGIPESEMFLVIARDLVRRADHAVLAVRVDDGLLILDSQTDHIIDARDIRDYRPIMSYAGGKSWTHGYRVSPAHESWQPQTLAMRARAAAERD